GALSLNFIFDFETQRDAGGSPSMSAMLSGVVGVGVAVGVGVGLGFGRGVAVGFGRGVAVATGVVVGVGVGVTVGVGVGTTPVTPAAVHPRPSVMRDPW